MLNLFRSLRLSRVALSGGAASVLLLSSCGGVTSSNTTTTTTTTTTANPYAAVYQALVWPAGVTASFPTSCSMTVTASGTPPAHNDYYLAPAGTGQTVVATTPSGIQLAVIAYAGTGISSVSKISATFNICPAKATSTTATTGGAIGFISSGEVLFNPYEATKTVAMGDNASYTFMTGGKTYTAYFLDQCNSHPTAGMGASGSTWHYHGNPVCYTAAVDGASGPSHLIGIALDGYPIYGGRDVDGNLVDVTKLDACNGITSATPEFPKGAYHYVLPVGVTTAQSSLGCYTGTVSGNLVAQMKTLGCKMPMLLANGKMRLPDGREIATPKDARKVDEIMMAVMAGQPVEAVLAAQASAAWRPKGGEMKGMAMKGM